MSWRPDPPESTEHAKVLSRSIDALLARRGLEEISLLSRVSEIWVEVVGENVAQHVQPAAIADGVLIVDVDQPAWATEVTFLATTVLDKLADRLGRVVASALKPRVRGSPA